MFFFFSDLYSRNVRAYIKLKRTSELAACPGTQIYELSDNRLRGFHTLYLTGDIDLEYILCVYVSVRLNNIKTFSFLCL